MLICLSVHVIHTYHVQSGISNTLKWKPFNCEHATTSRTLAHVSLLTSGAQHLPSHRRELRVFPDWKILDRLWQPLRWPSAVNFWFHVVNETVWCLLGSAGVLWLGPSSLWWFMKCLIMRSLQRPYVILVALGDCLGLQLCKSRSKTASSASLIIISVDRFKKSSSYHQCFCPLVTKSNPPMVMELGTPW